MTLLRILSVSLLAAISFGSCRENFDTTVEREIGTLPTINVESSLVGQVLNEQGRPMAGAEVLVAGQELLTNSEGLFFVSRKLMDANGTAVQVRASGYFNTTRFAFPNLDATTHLVVKLIPKQLKHTFSAAQGGSFTLEGGASVNIPANALQDAVGKSYQGSVRAYAVWLDPTQAETFERMPGDLRGSDREQQPRLLRTFGMLGVVLEGADGSPLNIQRGRQAKIVLPIPESLRSAAPASIPLWHFDEKSGYWVEEGAATRRENRYEGEVAHFSFWNVDVPGNFIKLSGSVLNNASQSLANILIKISSPTMGIRFSGLDEKGQFSGLVPTNEALKIEVIITQCAESIYSASIGPFTADAVLAPIKVSPSIRMTTIRGTATNCNNQALPNAIVIFNAPQKDLPQSVTSVVADANGRYENAR